MRDLINPDSPFVRMLSRLGDMIIVNFLCLICCLPVITAGAALSAAHRLMQDIVMNREGALFKTYLRVFKETFRQATPAWLMLLLITVSLVCDFFLIGIYCTDTLAMALYALLFILAFVVLGTAVFLFPLLARYQNTLMQHLRNALILMITKLPRTLAMILLHALPFIVLLLSPMFFLQTLFFWLLIGVALIIYLDTLLLKPVFLELEA